MITLLLLATLPGLAHGDDALPPAPGQVAAAAQSNSEEAFATLRISLHSLEASHQGPWTSAEVAGVRDQALALARIYPEKAESHVILAEFLSEINRPREASAELEMAIKKEPDRVDVLVAQSTLLLNAGNTVEATRLLEMAVTKAPQDAALHFALANRFYLFRQDLFPVRHSTETAMLDLALHHFHTATELAPQSLTYARAYAETFYAMPQPDWKTARDAWTRVLALSSDPSFARTHLARVHIRLNDKTSARTELAHITDERYNQVKKALERQIDRLP